MEIKMTGGVKKVRARMEDLSVTIHRKERIGFNC
ncbi:MAG: hypothetical protein H6Q21_2425 [Bacteroidetes bacterium]|nr:hypothetical protein [Bacteroidota bacterium]